MFVTTAFVFKSLSAASMANPSREPISHRERPAKPALSRQAIVVAALRLIRSLGNDGLTMRRLAAAGQISLAPLAEMDLSVLDASVVASLASPAGHWVNGQTIRANGEMN